jgi:hypothetical protein
MVILLEPLPHRDRVRIVLDDAIVKLTLQRDKFLDMMRDILDIDDPEVRPNFLRIREILYRYGGFYLYDRFENKFYDLAEMPFEKRISPRDLLEATKRVTKRDPRESVFRELRSRHAEIIKNTVPAPPKGMINRLNVVVRNTFQKFTKKSG